MAAYVGYSRIRMLLLGTFGHAICPINRWLGVVIDSGERAVQPS